MFDSAVEGTLLPPDIGLYRNDSCRLSSSEISEVKLVVEPGSSSDDSLADRSVFGVTMGTETAVSPFGFRSGVLSLLLFRDAEDFGRDTAVAVDVRSSSNASF